MPKSSKKHSSRRRQVHLFETPQFKAELKRSINENLDKMVQEGFTFPTHIPLEQLLAPCKKTRGKKGRITRPQNAFILYRKDLQDKIKDENPDADFKEISRIAGNRWKHEVDHVKNNYTLLATLGGLVHQDLFPNYKYQPRQRDERKSFEDGDDYDEFTSDRSTKPWESMPQLFNNNNNNNNYNTSEFTQDYSNSSEMNFQDNILISPQIIQISEDEQPVMNVMNLVESYYEPSIPLNQSPKIEPPDDLNCYEEFHIDDNVINNLNNGLLSSLNNEHTYNNNINSPENSTNDEISDLLIFPTVNSFNIQPETTQSSTYVPQVNTTIPSFYASIIDNIPVYGDQIAPILTVSSDSENYTPVQNIQNVQDSLDESLQTYDMGFLNDWANEELIGNLYQS
ncbi:unnamed protein product [Rhizophagus irregularis]|nr:unnamed protein product [Rhizophagus irregularis]CAB4430174.1 unnamed protein product [Rhizophagus irregularis]